MLILEYVFVFCFVLFFGLYTRTKLLKMILYPIFLFPLPVVFSYKTKADNYLQSWPDILCRVTSHDSCQILQAWNPFP